MAWSIEHGMRVADREIETFRSAIRSGKFTNPVALHARAFRADIEGGRCVLRLAGRVSAKACVRHANAFHRLARAISAQRMSSPAALVRLAGSGAVLPAHTDVVAVEHAPSSYIDGEDTDRAVIARIAREQRHLGAFLSYVSHLADHGSERNLLFSTRLEQFPFWFVDLDFAFGDVMPWGYGKALFYPGHRLNYEADGYSARLPARASQLLEWMDGQRASSIAQRFGLALAEADDLRTRCLRVRDIGLPAAIAAERFWQAAPGIVGRLKGRARAKAEKYLISCRAAGHWCRERRGKLRAGTLITR
jgi:hypothetical protein